MSQYTYKFKPDDQVIENWLKAQKNKQQSIGLVIQHAINLYGDGDIYESMIAQLTNTTPPPSKKNTNDDDEIESDDFAKRTIEKAEKIAQSVQSEKTKIKPNSKTQKSEFLSLGEDQTTKPNLAFLSHNK